MATAHTLEELVQLLTDKRKIWLSNEELEKLGLSEIVKHRLESWGMPAAIYDPKGGMELAQDPVDMIKVEPPSEAEMALVPVTELIEQAQADLRKPAEQSSNLSSWKIEHHSQRAQALAQIASAQAQYAMALQLSRIGDLCEDLLQAKDD